jgi:hypothetical protein
MLVVDKPNLPLTFIHITRGPLTAPLSIERFPAPAAGFQVFAKNPFAPDNTRSHRLDHRWALNLRSMHPNADFNGDAAPMVTLNTGILYAANLTREGLNAELTPAEQPPTRPNRPLHTFAADLAVAIDIPRDSALVVRWEESGEQQILTLPRESDPQGTTYTISLMNDPEVTNPPPHDELALYYQVLRDSGAQISQDEQFRISVPPGRSDEIPCMPVVLDP